MAYYGVGVNDYDGALSRNGRPCKFYSVWSAMLRRCYAERRVRWGQCELTRYDGCSVDPVWHSLRNFKQWFDVHYVDGWQLDKDALTIGNRVYGPDHCVFLPRRINSLIIGEVCQNPQKAARVAALIKDYPSLSDRVCAALMARYA